MLVEDCQSSGPIVHDPPTVTQSRVCHQKYDVYIEVLRRLQESNHEKVAEPGFEEELLAHFNRLPAWYALDVNVERAGPAVEIRSCFVAEIASLF